MSGPVAPATPENPATKRWQLRPWQVVGGGMVAVILGALLGASGGSGGPTTEAEPTPTVTVTESAGPETNEIERLTSEVDALTDEGAEAAPEGDGAEGGGGGDEPTVSQANAVRQAESYLELSAFSRSGLIDQLEFEGYTRAQAEYGVNQVGL